MGYRISRSNSPRNPETSPRNESIVSAGNTDLPTLIMHHVVDGNAWHPFPGLGFHLPEFPALHVGGLTINLSITLHVLMLLIGATLTFLLLRAGAKRNGHLPANKFGHAIEAVVLFLRDGVARPSLGLKEGDKWMPFLGTIFFFILVLNLVGLIPLFAGATANISVTAALAILIFLTFNITGMRHNGVLHYISNLVPKGIPFPILIILAPIEVISLFIRAFSLTLRLFANMAAGHIMIMVLVGLISVFSALMPTGVTLGLVAPITIAFTVFILIIKVGVCFLQAYVFTLLSSLYIGGAIHQEH
jgi:F-type H+-transporting ATPase subunit a